MNKVMKMLQKYEIFSSGCHGNQNNFATYQQCRKRCSIHITQQSKKGKNIQEAKGSGRFAFLFVSDSQRMCLFIFFFFWDYRCLLFNQTIAYFFWQVWKKIALIPKFRKVFNLNWFQAASPPTPLVPNPLRSGLVARWLLPSSSTLRPNDARGSSTAAAKEPETDSRVGKIASRRVSSLKKLQRRKRRPSLCRFRRRCRNAVLAVDTLTWEMFWDLKTIGEKSVPPSECLIMSVPICLALK